MRALECRFNFYHLQRVSLGMLNYLRSVESDFDLWPGRFAARRTGAAQHSRGDGLDECSQRRKRRGRRSRLCPVYSQHSCRLQGKNIYPLASSEFKKIGLTENPDIASYNCLGPLLRVHGVCRGGESSWFLHLWGSLHPHSGPQRVLHHVRRCSAGPCRADEWASPHRLALHPQKHNQTNWKNWGSVSLDSRFQLLGWDRCWPRCFASQFVGMWDWVHGEQSPGRLMEKRIWFLLAQSFPVSIELYRTTTDILLQLTNCALLCFCSF